MRIVELLHEELDALPCGDDASLLSARAAVYVLDQIVSYEYTAPIRDARQRLMIVPRPRHGDQTRVAHRLDLVADDRPAERVERRVDEFGNEVVDVHADGVAASLRFSLRALVRRDRRRPEIHEWRSPVPAVTALTQPDEALRDAARGVAGDDVTALAERMCDLVHQAFTYRHGETGVRTTAAQAWAGRVGVCQDMAHVMIAMCASRGVAARYVSGHLVGDGASHAWVEVHDPARRAVVSVDPTHARRTDLRYVVTAVGRDYADVAPTSGTYVSRGATGSLAVSKRIRLADVV
ncbi:MAG: transglutaminase family protein [Ilumatobacteraceae bacterium]